ncbi:CPXCG motif-containing cysteine-rich protein [Tamlana agarivorans]|uniref:CPXCG motif-containing cysteine-rich protein n=1 Tax=Pseudotamlana agarivorans TaxID=481183 RepID=A0ACC5UBY4_9FLAO|nr:CPXCG motif-containing cysteine-rich protein [Tamlana agarivorans]MBU2951858.1 CPXCG motif-containing cysteine-rich protein [Tamlana agarivorans]
MKEHSFTCPYCWETITVLIDTSIESQRYIEDCEVCCNPFQVSLKIKNTELLDFQALSIEQ